MIEDANQRAVEKQKAQAYDDMQRASYEEGLARDAYGQGAIDKTAELNALMGTVIPQMYDPKDFNIGDRPTPPMEAIDYAIASDNPVLPSPNTGDEGLASRSLR
jgi:hypothetical protein